MDGMDDFFANLGEFTDLTDYESFEGEETELRQEKWRRRTNRFVTFYTTRKDVLIYFEEDKLLKTFRFDRNSIEFITGNWYHRLRSKDEIPYTLR